MSLVDLCRLFHLTHKHILDTFLASTVLRLQYGKYGAQITIWLLFYCWTRLFSLPFLLLSLLPLPPPLCFPPSLLLISPFLLLRSSGSSSFLLVFPSLPFLPLLHLILLYHLTQLYCFHHPLILLLQRCIFPWQRKRTTSLSRTNFLGKTPTLLSLRLYWWSLSR